MTENHDHNHHNNNNLEAALDQLRTAARLQKHSAALPLGDHPNLENIDLATFLTSKPLELTHSQDNQPDVRATQLLLDTYHREDGWHCPRCKFTTTNADDFAQHLIDEINKAIASLAKQTPKLR